MDCRPLFLVRKKPYMPAKLANCSYINRQHNPAWGKLLRHGKRCEYDMVTSLRGPPSRRGRIHPQAAKSRTFSLHGSFSVS